MKSISLVSYVAKKLVANFFLQVVNRIINFVMSANDVAFSEELLIAGNQCLMELSRCLQGHLASHSHHVAIFVLRQLDDEDLCTQRHAASIVKLLAQVLIGVVE